VFSGIIEHVAEVVSINDHAIVLNNVFSETAIKPGDSVAVNGACLTVVVVDGKQIEYDLLPETFQGTNLKTLRPGSVVNVERALLADGRFDGHMVSGHIDMALKIISVKKIANTYQLQLERSSEIDRYLVKKGSVALNGISLTVQTVQSGSFSVSVIPFSYHHTNLHEVKAGEYVNIEVDLVARYLEGLISSKAQGLSYEKLVSQGF